MIDPRLDWAESVALARRVDAQIKQCWRNAILALNEPGLEDARYIEGWAIVTIFPPIEHGWVERADGTLLDPTAPLWRTPPTTLQYFPGIAYSRFDLWGPEGWMVSKRQPVLFPLVVYGAPRDQAGMRNPAYAQAWLDAFHSFQCGGIDHEHTFSA